MPRNPQVVNEIPAACFAPPLTEETLEKYEGMAEAHGGEVGGILGELLACVNAWWKLPESTRTDGDKWTFQRGAGGPVVTVSEVPLEADHVRALDAVTPWMRELNTLSTPAGDGPLDALPPGELRDAAFHLLWYCKELTLDREPMSRDKLPEVVPDATPTPRRRK